MFDVGEIYSDWPWDEHFLPSLNTDMHGNTGRWVAVSVADALIALLTAVYGTQDDFKDSENHKQ